MRRKFNPVEALAAVRHEFGEHGGVNMSIEASTTYTVIDPRTMPEIFTGRRGPDAGGCFLYARHFNPTVYVLGRELAALEGTGAGYATASGMSAIAAVLMQLCGTGDEIVASSAVYGGTFALLDEFFPAKSGVKTTFVDITDLEAVEAALSDKTRVLYTESMSNPTLAVADLPGLADIARRHHVKLVVDNTFCPLVLSPVEHGADVVVHSLTKFIGGASDLIAGAVCASKELIAELMDLHTGALMLLGPTMDPRIAFQISMRLPHLPLRIKEHSRRAQVFAERLSERGISVVYPGLPSHPQHALARELCREEFGFGGLLAIDLGTAERANEFLGALQNQANFGYVAVSLGYHNTLVSASASSTSSEMSAEQQQQAGISPGLVRMSIGYTGGIEQRWAQLEEALAAVGL